MTNNEPTYRPHATHRWGTAGLYVIMGKLGLFYTERIGEGISQKELA